MLIHHLVEYLGSTISDEIVDTFNVESEDKQNTIMLVQR